MGRREASNWLWPPPQRVELGSEGWRPGAEPCLRVAAPWPGHADVVDTLRDRLAASGIDLRRDDEDPRPAIRLVVDRDLPRPAGGYRLRIDRRGVELVGRDVAGVRHGVVTFGQWLELNASNRPSLGELPGLVVEDWPDLARRGFMLDVSRDRVPTMASLRQLVDVLAGLKLNELQLYVEHAFAYVGHELVWQDASPLTGDELRELDALCRCRGIELVANQNSLGHFHRWLRLPRYRALAECPDGVEHPFTILPPGAPREPFSLCPADPAVLALLAGLYDQLLPPFTARVLNAGLDETFDLGLGRSQEAVGARGRAAVYLEHVQAVHRLLSDRGCRLELWADIVLEHPELASELPADVSLLAWGYEAEHPFVTDAERLAAAGREVTLCPGTSSWQSLAGRTENALRNLASAVRAARTRGARGVLITDWGDFGHLQPPAVSWGPLVAGAGWAWNGGAAPAAEAVPDLGAVARAVASHVLGSGAAVGLARAALDLGNVYRRLGTRNRNGSALFHLLVFPHQDLTHARYRGLAVEGLDRAERMLDEVGARLGAAPAGSPEALRVRDELVWVAELSRLGCALGRARLDAGAERMVEELPPAVRQRLSDRLRPLLDQHRALWLGRSRPGGRRGSRAHLERLDRLLRA